MEKIFLVSKEYIGTRIDRWIKKNISRVPQSLIEKNLRNKNITVNSLKVRGSYNLILGDKIILKGFYPREIKKDKRFKYAPKSKEIFDSLNFIIENNENFIVVNKPAGLSVQAGTKSPKNLIDIISKNKIFSKNKLYVVHRIDKETSGILIIAKNREYAQLFTSLFRIRKIHKSYLSISYGEIKNKKGRLNNKLIRHEKKRTIIENAITDYKVLDKNDNSTLLLLNPITGRKHQIRKQLSLIGHPILGDSKYDLLNNINKGRNLLLHSYSIKFIINNKKFNFVVDIPEYFRKMLISKKLRFLKNP